MLLHCEVHGKPPPVLLWRKDGKLLPTDPRVTILPEGALEITRATVSDAGKYRCVAENVAGTRTSKEAKLTVVSGMSRGIHLHIVSGVGDYESSVCSSLKAKLSCFCLNRWCSRREVALHHEAN